MPNFPYWKWALLLALALILAALMYGVALVPPQFIANAWLQCLYYVIVSGIMLILYRVFVEIFEKEDARDLPKAAWLKDTGKGLGIGLCYFILVVMVMMVLGCYRIEGFGKDYMGIVQAFFVFLAVAVGEEIMFRGVLFRWIDGKFGFAAALVVSAMLFGALHLPNPGATWWSSLAIAIEAGLLLAAAYKWSGTLWLPIGIHWAWNFSQGNIFGFDVSGGDAGASLIIPYIDGPEILTGGDFGAEASIIAVFLGAAISAWFIVQIARAK